MSRFINGPSQSLAKPFGSTLGGVGPAKRLLHASPRLFEDGSSDTSSQSTTNAAPQPNPATPVARGGRSTLALRQVQRLRENRIRQGIVGITRGGFEPKSASASSREGSQRPPTQSSSQSHVPIRRVIPPVRDPAAPASEAQSTVPQLHIRRTTAPRTGGPGFSRGDGPRNGSRTGGTTRSREPNAERASRRKAGGAGGGGMSVQAMKAEEKASEELFWMQYDQSQVQSADTLPYNPGLKEYDNSLEIKTSTLATDRTASFAGSTGPASEMAAVLGRLAHRRNTAWAVDAEIARRLLRGEIVRFNNDEEQRRILALAEQMALQTAWAQAEAKNVPFSKRDVSFAPIAGAHRGKLVDRVLKGHYELHDNKKDKTAAAQTFGRLETALQMKETYTPSASKAFLQTFQKLWPAQTPPQKGGAKSKRQ